MRCEHRRALSWLGRCGLMALGMASLQACSLVPVQAWDKQDLARPEMAIEPDRLDAAHTDHIHFSREGAAGGWRIGGGGCGCN